MLDNVLSRCDVALISHKSASLKGGDKENPIEVAGKVVQNSRTFGSLFSGSCKWFMDTCHIMQASPVLFTLNIKNFRKKNNLIFKMT